jgi:hypothetical protein
MCVLIAVIAWIFSTIRLIAFFDGRSPNRTLPVFGEYNRPNV